MHIKLYLLALTFIFGLSNAISQNRELDSLKRVLPQEKDTVRVYALIAVAWKARDIDPTITIEYAKKALKLAKDTLKNEKMMARSLNYLGVGYRNISNFKQALESFFTASKLSEKTNSYETLGYSLQSISDIYNRQGKYADALKYIERANTTFERIKDKRGIGYYHYTLGQIYHNQKKYIESIKNYQKSILIREELKDKDGASAAMNRLALVYTELGEYKDALKLHLEALEVYQKLDSKRNIVWVNIGIVQMYRKIKQYNEAIDLLKKYIPLAQKTNAKDYLREIYHELSACYASLQDYPNAYQASQQHIAYKDSLFAVSTLQDQIVYDKEKENREIEELKNNERTAWLFFYYVGAVTLLILLLITSSVFFLIRSNRKQKKANKLLEEKKQEIELKNEYINSSIMYAKTIQDAVLPTQELMQNVFPEHFILNLPKDVVSGDFYWLTSFHEGHIFVVADCTGHGVAGAFMTLIGGALLDKMTHTEGIKSPQEILYRLHIEIKELLHQEQTGNNNGMDAIVLYIESKENTFSINFCGAKNSLFYRLPNDNKMMKLAGDRRGVGGLQNERVRFINQTIELPKGTMLYFGSDGLEDQNDLNRKKLGQNRLTKFLLEIADLSMTEQKKRLEAFLDTFMQGTVQRDDILWLGIRLDKVTKNLLQKTENQ